MQCAVGELHQQDKKQRRTWNETDLIAIVRHRTNHVIWDISKVKFTSSNNRLMVNFVRLFLRQELGLSTEELDKHWPVFSTTITEALRTKRSTCAQSMKKDFFGKGLFFVPFLMSLLCCLCV